MSKRITESEVKSIFNTSLINSVITEQLTELNTMIKITNIAKIVIKDSRIEIIDIGQKGKIVYDVGIISKNIAKTDLQNKLRQEFKSQIDKYIRENIKGLAMLVPGVDVSVSEVRNKLTTETNIAIQNSITNRTISRMISQASIENLIDLHIEGLVSKKLKLNQEGQVEAMSELLANQVSKSIVNSEVVSKHNAKVKEVVEKEKKGVIASMMENWIVIIVVIILSLLAIGAIWYFMTREDKGGENQKVGGRRKIKYR